MNIVDSEETTHNGQEGTLYKVDVTSKTERDPSIRDAEDAAARKAKGTLGMRYRTLDFANAQVLSVQMIYDRPFGVRADWRVEVFRPHG